MFHSRKNWNKKIWIATIQGTEEDIYGNEKIIYNKPELYEMNAQPLSAKTEQEYFGTDIIQKYRIIIEKWKYDGMFHENDLVYLDGATPEGETVYGENANYQMLPPRYQNKCILIHVKRKSTK